MFKRVTIIGLGFIGGSLGLAIKERHIAKEVVGLSRSEATVKRALSLGIIDRGAVTMKDAVQDSDLIILTAPVLKIIDNAEQISAFLKKGAIVTDAGSTKKKIVKRIERLLPHNVSFVGSHPLAGSEKSGLLYADKSLFKGAHCILTKTTRTNLKVLGRMKRFWEKLGMKVETMTPEKHDKIISRLSHLPHAVSIGLSNSVGKRDLHLAAGGFRDTTRIASSSPELWRDIFVTNRKNIIEGIRALKKELTKIEDALKDNNSSQLLRLFRKAKSIRDSIS